MLDTPLSASQEVPKPTVPTSSPAPLAAHTGLHLAFWGAKSAVFVALGGEGSAPGLSGGWHPCGCGMDTAPCPGRQRGSSMLGCGHGKHGPACVSPRRWLAQAVQVLFCHVRSARRHPLMRANSSVCWGDRQRDSSPDHAGNTDSTAKKPLVTLE